MPLASVSDPALVPSSIVQSFDIKLPPNVSPLQHLISYVQDKQLLLILDNFEHVQGAAIVVDEMLAAAPELKVLITSRAVLHLYGEYQFGVPPLDVPPANGTLDAVQLSQFAAIQLFVERAQAVVADFALTELNANGSVNTSFGTNSSFLLQTGHNQVRDVFKLITGDAKLDLYAQP